MVVHEKYVSAAFTRTFSPVNAAAITRERSSISAVLKLFQFPEHLTVMLLSMERATFDFRAIRSMNINSGKFYVVLYWGTSRKATYCKRDT